jgi:23S rRNA pseudouridine1911/1915/1917 synthase
MTRSSSLRARKGTSKPDDYSPSDRPADAPPGDSLDDDMTADALHAPAAPPSAGNASDVDAPDVGASGVDASGGETPRIVDVPPALAGERLDKALAQLFPEFSRSRLQSWIDAQRVRVDGAPAKIRQPVPLGATIELVPDLLPEQLAFTPEPVPLAVVYEDDALVVIDKPAGLVVHPAAGNWSGTLLNGLLYRYGEAAAGLPRAGIVHRLDKETSGLMVVARTLAAQTDLVRQLQARTVKRRYFALVWGSMPDEGTIDAPIGRDPRERTRMAVVTGASGKPARTHFRTVDTCSWQGQPVSAIQCDLETGRTHQIRVHCAHLGHPLLGDPVYGRAARGKRSVAPLPGGFARQALHAWRLGLVHPVTGKPMRWRCALPDDLTALIDALGFGRDDAEFDDADGIDHDDWDDAYLDDAQYDDEEE